LTRQLEADRKTIAAFQKEYELGQRSLIDLLNAQNQFFNASVSLTSARSLVVFADYQLLAAMGSLVEYLKAPPPVDAAPVDTLSFGLPAYSLPMVRIKSPQTGSEPLRVANAPGGAGPAAAYASIEPQKGQAAPQRTAAQTTQNFGDRWPSSAVSSNVPGASEWIAQQKDGNGPTVIYGAPDPASASSFAKTNPQKPHWLLSAFPTVQR